MKTMLLIFSLSIFCFSENIINGSYKDNQGNRSDIRVDQYKFGSTWNRIEAELSVVADHQRILHGTASAYVAGNSFGASTSFEIGPEGFQFKCKEISFEATVTDATVTGSFNVDRCELIIGDFQTAYYESLDFALTKDELSIRYAEELGITVDNIRFIKIGGKIGGVIQAPEGAVFRSGPGREYTPIARMGFSGEIAFLGDDRDHRGWVEVLVCTNESGYVKGYIGKRLTNTGEVIDTTFAIPPLEELFQE